MEYILIAFLDAADPPATMRHYEPGQVELCLDDMASLWSAGFEAACHPVGVRTPANTIGHGICMAMRIVPDPDNQLRDLCATYTGY